MRRVGSFLKKSIARLFATKRPFKLTRPGWVFILYSIGVGAGAINTGNNLLYIVFGIFLGLLLASGTLSDLSLWGLEVDWILPSSLRAGERADVWITVRNSKRWWSSLGVSIVFEGTLAGQPVRFSAYAPCVRKNAVVRLPAGWTPDRRGEFVLNAIRVSTRYPFGLLEKWWRVYRGEPRSAALVQPRRVPVSERVLWSALAGDELSASRNARTEGPSSSTVRDYHAGDNPRRIHWRASAKRGALGSENIRPAWLVRQMEPEEQHRVLLEFPSISESQRLDVDRAELLVSFSASLRDSITERGWRVDFILEEALIVDVARVLALWDPRSPWQNGGVTRADADRRGRVSVSALFESSRKEPGL